MPQTVRAVIARTKGDPVEVVDIVVPDPGPGEAVVPYLIDLYKQGRLDLDCFVSETIGLDAVEEAFTKMHDGQVLRSVVVL